MLGRGYLQSEMGELTNKKTEHHTNKLDLPATIITNKLVTNHPHNHHINNRQDGHIMKLYDFL